MLIKKIDRSNVQERRNGLVGTDYHWWMRQTYAPDLHRHAAIPAGHYFVPAEAKTSGQKEENDGIQRFE